MNHTPAALTSRELRARLEALLSDFREHGEPPRATLRARLGEIAAFREANGSPVLRESPRVLVTATLDDGLGHGIETVALCARACGMEVRPRGLCAAPEDIAEAVREARADMCAVTVLRTDAEASLAHLAALLPPSCLLVAGGPAILYDPDLAARSGVRHPTPDLPSFLALLLSFGAEETTGTLAP